MLKIHSLIIILSFVITPFFQAPQPETNPLHPSVVYDFGNQLTITGWFDPSNPIEQIIVFIKSGRADIIQGTATIAGSEFEYSLDLATQPLPPFAEVSYWFGVSYSNGDTINTADDPHAFRYDDNRNIWNHQQNEIAIVNWIDGDPGFGQQALEAAQIGLEEARTLLPALPLPTEPTQIYIYPSARDVQEALQLASFNWVAGHADPWLNIVLASIPAGPEQKTELQRQIPHELMHIWLYNFTEGINGDYQALPAWLNEGLATLVERFTVTGYPALLAEAYTAESLLPVVSLCDRFPSDTSLALLAYAQSASFTRYILQNYGSSGLEKLIRFYADGLECERGIEEAFGISLAQIEQEWITDTFGARPPSANTFQATPYLILFGVIILVPLFFVVMRRHSIPEPPNQ